MIGKQHAIVLDEVEQVGHLFQVGGDQRRAIACWVALEVHIVEDDGDNMLDLSTRGVELTASRRTGGCGTLLFSFRKGLRGCGRRRRQGGGQKERERNKEGRAATRGVAYVRTQAMQFCISRTGANSHDRSLPPRIGWTAEFCRLVLTFRAGERVTGQVIYCEWKET